MTDTPVEEWRPLPDYEGLYEVSNLGRVRSLHERHKEPRLCFIGTDSCGYLTVGLNRAGKRTTRTVHRLVCRAFHGEQPNPLHNEVGHLDGNRTNARADNLKWVSKRENHSHRRLHGTAHIGSAHPRALLSEADVTKICQLLMVRSARSVADQFGVSSSAIEDIRSGKNWRHVQRPDGFNAVIRTGHGQCGEFNHNARLSSEQVTEMRSRYAKGERAVALASEFKISRAAAFKALRGDTYRAQSLSGDHP
jgi:hypothetical protein